MLGAGVTAFAADDEPGAVGPSGHVDAVGEVGDEGVVAGLAGGLVGQWCPGVVVDMQA